MSQPTSRYRDLPGVNLSKSNFPEHLMGYAEAILEWSISDTEEVFAYRDIVGQRAASEFVQAIDQVLEKLEAFCAEHESEVPVPDVVVATQIALNAYDLLYTDAHSGA
jgi:hypothetical protein